MGVAEYVKAFKVASSLDGRTYTMYRLEGQKKDTVSPNAEHCTFMTHICQVIGVGLEKCGNMHYCLAGLEGREFG